MMRILVVLAFCLGPTFASAAASDGPCVAAMAQEDFAGLVLPPALKADIVAYRKVWRSYCGRRSPQQVASLFAAMQKLGQKMASTVPELPVETFSTVVEKLPKFVPAIRCFLYDGGANCDASYEEFAKTAAEGTKDDLLFAQSYRDLRGYEVMPPWIEPTWDYGGCTRYGEYDWVAKLRLGDGVMQKLTSPTYRHEVLGLQHAMLNTLTSELARKATCSCGAKEAPLRDLAALVAYLEKSKDLAAYLAPLRELLAGLQKKTFTLRSQKEAHCSGG